VNKNHRYKKTGNISIRNKNIEQKYKYKNSVHSKRWYKNNQTIISVQKYQYKNTGHTKLHTTKAIHNSFALSTSLTLMISSRSICASSKLLLSVRLNMSTNAAPDLILIGVRGGEREEGEGRRGEGEKETERSRRSYHKIVHRRRGGWYICNWKKLGQ
jgi:hypothetical protein